MGDDDREKKRIQLIPADGWEFVGLDDEIDRGPDKPGVWFEPVIAFALLADGSVEPVIASSLDGLPANDWALRYKSGKIHAYEGTFESPEAWVAYKNS